MDQASISKDAMPFLTMAGAMKLVSAYFQPMADRNTNKAIDASGARGAEAAVNHIQETMENLDPETNAQAAMGGVSVGDFCDLKTCVSSFRVDLFDAYRAINDVQKVMIGVTKAVANVQTGQAELKAGQADMNAKLDDTKTELDDTKAKLDETKTELEAKMDANKAEIEAAVNAKLDARLATFSTRGVRNTPYFAPTSPDERHDLIAKAIIELLDRRIEPTYDNITKMVNEKKGACCVIRSMVMQMMQTQKHRHRLQALKDTQGPVNIRRSFP